MATKKPSSKTEGYYIRLNGQTCKGLFLNVVTSDNSIQTWGYEDLQAFMDDLLAKGKKVSLEVVKTSGAKSDDCPI